MSVQHWLLLLLAIAIALVLTKAARTRPDPITWICSACRSEFTTEPDAREHVLACTRRPARVMPIWPRSPFTP